MSQCSTRLFPRALYYYNYRELQQHNYYRKYTCVHPSQCSTSLSEEVFYLSIELAFNCWHYSATELFQEGEIIHPLLTDLRQQAVFNLRFIEEYQQFPQYFAAMSINNIKRYILSSLPLFLLGIFNFCFGFLDVLLATFHLKTKYGLKRRNYFEINFQKIYLFFFFF